MTGLRHLLEASLFALLMAVTRFLPRGMVRAAGRFAGDLGRLLDRRHNAIALANLSHALPDLDRRDREAVVRKCWRHFGEIVLDTLTFHRLGPLSIGRDVHYEGLQHLKEAHALGKGVLLFSGHFGHWELMALMQGHIGLPLSIVARPLDNPRLEKMLATLRGSSGNTLLHKRSAVRAMLRVIRSGGLTALLIDQDARGDGVFAPFFGRPASTTPTLAMLAIRTGAPIVPFLTLPGADGSWKIIYLPVMLADRNAERAGEVQRITADCTAMLEGWIRERPELWLWMHRRWKTRPASAVE